MVTWSWIDGLYATQSDYPNEDYWIIRNHNDDPEVIYGYGFGATEAEALDYYARRQLDYILGTSHYR